MRIRNLNKEAFSLLEILLASVIFIITVAGVFATINAVRQPVLEKENQLTATILGQQLLENLRSQVSADQAYLDGNGNMKGVWALTNINALVTQANFPSITIPPGYTVRYTVQCADGTTTCGLNDTARKVSLNITYPDAQ